MRTASQITQADRLRLTIVAGEGDRLIRCILGHCRIRVLQPDSRFILIGIFQNQAGYITRIRAVCIRCRIQFIVRGTDLVRCRVVRFILNRSYRYIIISGFYHYRFPRFVLNRAVGNIECDDPIFSNRCRRVRPIREVQPI